jgi:hypothetical protein
MVTNVSNEKFVFPNHRVLDATEAQKMLALQSNYSRTVSWLKGYHANLIKACSLHKSVINLDGREFTLSPISGSDDLWLIKPSDGDFVPMSVFSLRRIEKEVRDARVEIS